MRILLSLLLVLVLVPTWSGDVRLPLPHAPMRLRATPVPLDPADPMRQRVGALTYLGGIRLSSRDPAFGGYSAMAVAGDRFTLLSDFGALLSFRAGPDLRISEARVGTLPAGPASGWRKEDRDSESLTLDPRTGRLWAGFEGSNEIWRYGRDFHGPWRGVAPGAMAKWTLNSGAESMVRLADGRFVVIVESGRWGTRRGRAAIVFSGDPVERPGALFRFRYVPPPGYDPSDMTELPDRRLVVLNRRAGWPDGFSAKLVVIDRRALRPGATVRGQVIATIAAPLTRDNFEAVAATREGGQTMLWLATDDNQVFVESTFLMKFRLDLP